MERIALIKREFNVDVTYYKLRQYYLKHGVKWRNTQMVYRNHLVKREGLDQERIQYIKSILKFIINDEPYVYLDEMAIHSFLTKNKAWSLADTPVMCPIES